MKATGSRRTARPCEGCGELSPEPVNYDVAIHDCETGEWECIRFTERGRQAIEALRENPDAEIEAL